MLTVEARAKVNLYLEVGDRRSDGYHDIRTIFHSISLADQITLEEASDLSVTCSDPAIPGGPTNLAFRAAEALARQYGVSRGARIAIRKTVPSQAGLGGGSTDAAGTLLGLNRLWNINAPPEELEAVGAVLGADVPFCVRGGAAFAEGIGEKLTPLPPLPGQWLVIVKPAAAISTREAYAALDARGARSAPGPGAALAVIREGRTGDLPGVLYNDFEPAALDSRPEIRRAFAAMKSLTRGALLCGSGSAVFGLLESESEARATVEQLQPAGCRCWPAQFATVGQILEGQG